MDSYFFLVGVGPGVQFLVNSKKFCPVLLIDHVEFRLSFVISAGRELEASKAGN